MTVRWRSVLFAPAGRPDLVAKLPRWGADVVVVDIEDGVPPERKDEVRSSLPEVLGSIGRMDPGSVFVRVNAPTSRWYDMDLRAVSGLPIGGIAVPKVEAPEQVVAVKASVPSNWTVIVGLETAMGVHRAVDVLAAGASAAYFGAEDFVTDIGGERTPAGNEVLCARSQVVLAARLAGVPAVDQAVVALGDDLAYRTDALAGRSMGYVGKLCVHPAQVAVANECFSVGEARLAWARRVVAAAAEETGAFAVDGQMIDEPIIRRARRWLAEAADVADDVPAR